MRCVETLTSHGRTSRTSTRIRRWNVPDVGHETTLRVPPYSPGEWFRPMCPREECSSLCDTDALYCAECGARLYTYESGKYGERT